MTRVAEYKSLNEAMVVQDDLAEAKRRRELLAGALDLALRARLCPAVERTKVEIVRPRAMSAAATLPNVAAGKVVARA